MFRHRYGLFCWIPNPWKHNIFMIIIIILAPSVSAIRGRDISVATIIFVITVVAVSSGSEIIALTRL